MKLVSTCVATALLFAAAAHAQSNNPGDSPAAAGSQAPALARLANDTLTLGEARAFIAAHEAEKAKLEAGRKEVLRKGAKSTAEERQRLIAEFRVAQKERIKLVEEQAPRAADLARKVREAEGPSRAPGKS